MTRFGTRHQALTVEEVVKGPEKEDLYVLGFGDKLVNKTTKHPFVYEERSQARHLTFKTKYRTAKVNS